MESNVIGSFVALSVRLRNQQKLVSKIEHIIRYQDLKLISEKQNLIRLRLLQDERRKLALLKEELYIIVDALSMPQ